MLFWFFSTWPQILTHSYGLNSAATTPFLEGQTMKQTLTAILIAMTVLMSGCDKISPFVDEAMRETVCDRDGDGFLRDSEYCAGTDCDDSSDSILDARGWFQDVDRDTYGAGEIEYHCNQPEGYVPEGGDCDDTEALVNPDAIESCNLVDDDCDGQTDEENILTWYLDADHDDYGNPDVSQVICEQPEGYVLNDQDCDDTDATVSPDGTEICDDGIDQDCNNILDDAADSQIWFADADLDSFGNPDVWLYSCDEEVEGYVANDLDCDDYDLDVRPDASEACDDEIDNDCDGEIDTDAVDVEWYRDEDGDGYGNSDQVLLDCSPPDGYVGNTDDCEDLLVDVNPEGTEICNDSLDNDCDGTPGECEYTGIYSLSTASSKLSGEASGDNAGSSASGVGDVSGDGIDDIAVGAPGEGGTGAVYIWFGPVPTGPLNLASADVKLTGEASGDYAGASVSGVGDVSGDGIDDLAVGATGESGTGAAYVVFGPLLPGETSLGDAELKLTGEVSGDSAGTYVGSAGDINSDGANDLAVGAPGDDTNGSGSGAVYVLFGPLLASVSEEGLADADLKLTGETFSDSVGVSFAGGEDLSGDGIDDLIVGSPGAGDGGAVYVLFGPLLAGEWSVESAEVKLTGEIGGDSAGWSVATSPDVNGDGFTDLLVGSPGDDTSASGAGAVYVMFGPLSPGQTTLGTANVKLTGEHESDNAGWSLAGVGDVNGDGLADILAGAIYESSTANYAGATYLILGSTSLTSGSLSSAAAKWTGESENDYAGSRVSGAGDHNNDGLMDFIVGAYQDDTNGPNSGSSYLINGLGL
jgi:hypothetical protein